MRLIIFLLVLIACTGTALAQVDRTVEGIRTDFREASVIVRMNITDTKVTRTDDPYAYYFIASGKSLCLSKEDSKRVNTWNSSCAQNTNTNTLKCAATTSHFSQAL
jgi:hypothetical protein